MLRGHAHPAGRRPCPALVLKADKGSLGLMHTSLG